MTDATVIRRASRNKTRYENLTKVGPSEDHKQIVFHFENGTTLFYSVAKGTWCHGDTGLPFGDSHFKNINWGRPRAGYLQFKPNREDFYTQLCEFAEPGWVRLYFTILCRWIKHYANLHENRRASDNNVSVRVVNRNNDVKMMVGPASMAIESLAKNNFIAQMNIDLVCRLAFHGSTVRDFKSIRDNCGMDAWFCQHLSEKSDVSYVVDRYNDTIDEGRRSLSLYVFAYQIVCNEGLGDLWQYVWEKYAFAMHFDLYGARRFKERVTELQKIGYKPRKVMDYLFGELPRQGITFSMLNASMDEMQILVDYAKMCSDMTPNGRFERYPRCLKMSHDIAQKNYRVKRSQIRIDKYEKIAKDELSALEWKGETHSIVAPKTLDEIVMEGSSLNHCVASYIDNVLDRKTTIMFLRKNDELEKSLVTVEIRDGKVNQARGQSNRDTTDEEKKILEQYRDHLDPSRQKSLFNVAEDLLVNPDFAEPEAA